jgi:small subunit ribosomal protein S16
MEIFCPRAKVKPRHSRQQAVGRSEWIFSGIFDKIGLSKIINTPKMLKIRFKRVGKRNQPAFKIVVVESWRASSSGKFVEEVGFYNPLTKEKVLRKERIEHWLKCGAKPSETVHNLLVREGIIKGKKIPKHKVKKEEKKETSPQATQ